MTRLILLFSLAACGRPVQHVSFAPPSPTRVDLDAPGPFTHDAVISARWSVPLHGLVDLDDPKAASLEDGPTPIVLPVHVLTHPTAGSFVVDTGMPAARWPIRGPLFSTFAADIQTVEPLAAILEGLQVSGVLLTHNHLDHVLGLVDVADDVPVHLGAGDEVPPSQLVARQMFPTFRRAMHGKTAHLWDFDGPDALDLEGIPAIDVLGDGSLFALDAHGHTPGSTAYLARTTDGPVLFVGDCSHTRWGWDHGVTPGSYTLDHAANAASLEALRALASRHPGMRIEVGHEALDDGFTPPAARDDGRAARSAPR